MIVTISSTTETAPAEAARERIIGLLMQHAAAAGHPFQNDKITYEALDEGVFQGGGVVRFGTDWAFVELLAVAPQARGAGVGRALMQAIEAEARARGLTGIWLDTYSFQAPGFYEALGFERLGGISEYPAGQARYFYARRLDGRAVNGR